MRTKELIKGLGSIMVDFSLDEKQDDVIEEVIQELREYGELKKLVQEIIDPLIGLLDYFGKIPNFQKGDINYGRKE